MSKVVIVTGASSGIGLEIACYLSGKGFIVYGASRSAPISKEFTAIKMDVTSEESVRSVVKEIAEKEGKIDVLINNAGVGSVGAVEQTPIDDIRKSFEVNFFGVVRTMQAVLPHMRKQNEGKIINISTLGSMIGMPFRGFYSASKGSMDLMTEALRLEIERFGIQACTVHPGDISTNIAAHRIVSLENHDEAYAKTLERAYAEMNASVDHGKDPAVFGPIVEKIIHSKKVKRNYYVGSFTEKLGITLKKFLPYYLYERILRSYFKGD